MSSDSGQPVGPEVAWSGAGDLPSTGMTGRHCALEPLAPQAHGDSLWAAFADEPRDWTYMGYGPFADRAGFDRWLTTCETTDPMFFAILVQGRAVGVASFLNVFPDAGTVEVGHIHYGPELQRTRAATEVMVLMMSRVFELGYRRYEWKCDALNARSRRSALRYGFSFEGVFRQHRVVKGRNRDTAWYACIDSEWPALRAAYAAWLDDGNFDTDRRQRKALATWTGPLLSRRG